jgi:putative colanic acid biosynthesis UDP-glucose lipid carrier transferase
VFALTFPGPTRFRDKLLSATVDIVSSWIALLFTLALWACATRSFYLFEDGALLGWALNTPGARWLACWAGQHVHRRFNAHPAARRFAVVVGAGPLGVKVSRAGLCSNRPETAWPTKNSWSTSSAR